MAEAVICGNVRQMQKNTLMGREKKLPLHLVAAIERKLNIPEPEITNLETKSTISKKIEVIPTALPSDHTRKQ